MLAAGYKSISPTSSGLFSYFIACFILAQSPLTPLATRWPPWLAFSVFSLAAVAGKEFVKRKDTLLWAIRPGNL